MEPNKKLITVLVLPLLAFIALNVFLILKYKTELSRQNEAKKEEETKAVLFQYINTYELPSAKVGEKYQSEVFATLTGANEDLTIGADGVPDGLTFGQCSQEFDSKFIPAPSTQTKCIIEGIPSKEGLYHLKISTTNKNNDGYNTVENTIDLTVTAR